MTGSMALRLFWKEYRVHRGLWLSALIGTVLLHGLLRALTDRASDLEEILWMTSAMLTGCFAVGAASVTFATEREDATHLRLISLSPSPTLTYLVKVIAILAGTAVLSVVTGFSALIISTRWYPATQPLDFLSFPARFCFWITAGVGICMLFSLLFRHVFAALLVGALGTVIAMMAVTITWETQETYYRHTIQQYGVPDDWYWATTGFNAFVGFVIFAIYCVNLVLARRWLSRAFFDDRPSRIRLWIGRTRIRRASLQGGMTVEVGVESDLTTPVLTPEEAAIQPAPRLSLSWLHMASGRRSLRPFRFLRWKEALETRVPMLIGAAVTAALTVVATEGAYHTPEVTHFTILIGIPALLGLMTFRSEQRHNRFRLLGEHGLSPRTVWFSKHAVWFPRMVALMLLVILLTSMVHGGRNVIQDLLRGLYCFDRDARFHTEHYSEFSRMYLGETPLFRGIVVTLFLYGIGQWASLTFRRGVLAAFATILGSLLMFLWLTFCSAGGIPVIVCLLPLLPALYLFTFLRASSWIIEREEKRVWLKPTLVLASGLAACFILTAVYRVAEIPSVAVADIERKSMSDADIAAFTAPLTADEIETAGLYNDALRRIPNKSTTWASVTPEFGRWSDVGDETRKWVADNQSALQMLRDVTSRRSCAFQVPGESRVQVVSEAERGTALALLKAAQVETQDGRIDEALDTFAQALAMYRHLAGRGGDPASRQKWQLHSYGILNALGWWATHPDVEESHVERATQIIRDHLRSLPGVTAIELARHEWLRNLVAKGPAALIDYAMENRSYQFHPAHWLFELPSEQMRMEKIVNYSDATQAGMILDLSALDRGETIPDLGPSFIRLRQRELRLRADLVQWKRTTPTLPPTFASDITELTRREINLRAKASATIVMMHLLLAERRDGELPETLDGLPDGLNDPWTGKPFAWYPDGITERVTSPVRIEPNIPFLFSGGPGHARIERQEYEVFEGGAEAGGMDMSMMGAGTVGPAVPEGFGQEAPPAAGGQDEGDAAEPELKTVVSYTVYYDSERAETPIVFILPRPEE